MLTRESSGYEIPKPEVIGLESMSPATLGSQMQVWGTTNPPRTANFHRLKDAFVVAEGLVFDSNQILIEESITQHDEQMIEAAAQSLHRAMQADEVPYTRGTTLLVGKIGLSNYGHWLVEMLPIAYLSLPWVQLEGGWHVFIPHVWDWMRDPLLASLDGIGVPPASIITNQGAPRQFEELVFVEGLSRHGSYYSPFAIEALDLIRSGVNASDADRIWVSRDGELRTMVNEHVLCRRLASLGWYIMHPRQMTLREQVEAAKGAHFMAGVNGAGLTNMGFMQPGGKVVSFVPNNMPDAFYCSLAHHRGLDFTEIRCPLKPAENWHIEWDGELQVDTESIVAFLQTRAGR